MTQWGNHTPTGKSMHVKTNWEITHAICYFQVFLLKLLDLALPCLILAFPPFHFLDFPFVLQENSMFPRVCEREGERENNERSPKLNWKNVTNWLSEAFLSIKPLFSSFSIIFLQFPPHIQPMTFHLPFLLFSFIFINKCAKMPFCLFNSFSLANFL